MHKHSKEMTFIIQAKVPRLFGFVVPMPVLFYLDSTRRELLGVLAENGIPEKLRLAL